MNHLEEAELREYLLKLAVNIDEKHIWARIWDLLVRSDKEQFPVTSMFLDPYQRQKLIDFFPRVKKRYPIHLCFWAGYQEAERSVAVFVPQMYWDAIQYEEFALLPFWEPLWGEDPLAYIRVHFGQENIPGHRDLLGAALGLGVERRSLGDILVADRSADLVVKSELQDFFLLHFTKAGRHDFLQQESISVENLLYIEPEYEYKKVSIGSMRLDSVLAAAWNMNREKAQEFIRKGLVSIDNRIIEKPAQAIQENSWLRCRGLGKVFIMEAMGESKKGRIFLGLRIFSSPK